MQWLRWYHGTAFDMKFGRIARTTGQTRERVVFVWAAILEDASDHGERGTFSILPGDIADVLKCDDEEIVVIMGEMASQGMTEGNRIVAWEKRQPSRDDSANRQRAKRERDADVTRTPRDSDAPVTPLEREQSRADTETTSSEVVVATPVPTSAISPAHSRAIRWPADAVVPDDWIAWARERRPEINAVLEAEKFQNYWPAQGGRDGAKLDWRKTWNNWILNAKGTSNAQRPDNSTSFTEIAARVAARKAAAGVG